MAEITIPDELLQQVENVLPESVSTETFIADAVREKLFWQKRKAEFYRLSDETRRGMDERGISEAEILSDFEAFRETLTRD
jgi:hypothetical protein